MNVPPFLNTRHRHAVFVAVSATRAAINLSPSPGILLHQFLDDTFPCLPVASLWWCSSNLSRLQCFSGGLPYGYMDQKELALCIRSVRLLECEATYYFPKALDVCGSSDSDSGRLATPASVSASSNGETAGNLVMHVRSGDVFRMGKAYGSYGQVSYTYDSNKAGLAFFVTFQISKFPNFPNNCFCTLYQQPLVKKLKIWKIGNLNQTTTVDRS